MNILNVCEAVMNVCGIYCQCVSQEMFDIIFVIHSVPATTDIEHHALCKIVFNQSFIFHTLNDNILCESKFLGLIEKLRETIKFGSNIEDLYCHYIRHLLANITSTICFWTLNSPDRCILNTILIHTGRSYLAILTF